MRHPLVTIECESAIGRSGGGLAKVPEIELKVEYAEAVRHHRDALSRLVVLVRRMVLETLGDVMPGVSTVIALGEFSEDWVPTLRIQRVLDAEGRVVFDAHVGHPDREVEDAVDLVETEYLDVLIDLAPSDYFGSVIID